MSPTSLLPQARYTRVAVILHWLIALLMIGNVLLAWSFDSLPDEAARLAVDTHKSIGITVFGLFILRLLWRIGHPPPPLPSRYQRWERRASHAVHGLMYALMLLLPLSGWVHDSAWKEAATHPIHLFGLVPFPHLGFMQDLNPATRESLHDLFGEAHETLGWMLYGLLALHIGGALKHQFIDRERELQRMW
jgi:cytochrome b561